MIRSMRISRCLHRDIGGTGSSRPMMARRRTLHVSTSLDGIRCSSNNSFQIQLGSIRSSSIAAVSTSRQHRSSHHCHCQTRCFSFTSTTTKQKTADFKYCVDLVQNRDREAYVCGLLLPKDARRSFFAIRSFNIELASIKDSQHSRNSVHTDNTATSKDSSLALKVRMQWWREALDHIYDGRNVMEHNPSHANDLPNLLAQSYGKNPVVRILQDAVKDKQLTRRFLERLLEAREGDLTVQQPVTEQEMLEYADAIQSSLLYLSLETCGVRDDAADVVAQHAGIGIGLVTALRGARIRLSKSGECPIPVELIETRHLFPYHKLILYDEIEAAKEENQLAPEERQIMQNAVEHVAGLAYYHLQKAQELQADVPKHARTCFLPVIPAMQYLSKLEAANYDLMDDRLLQQGSGYLKTLFLMTRTWLTGVF